MKKKMKKKRKRNKKGSLQSPFFRLPTTDTVKLGTATDTCGTQHPKVSAGLGDGSGESLSKGVCVSFQG